MQITLFEEVFDPPKFAGVTYDADLDEQRLTTLLQRVQKTMSGGQWYTLGELQAICGGSEAGLSARLRDLRIPNYNKIKRFSGAKKNYENTTYRW